MNQHQNVGIHNVCVFCFSFSKKLQRIISKLLTRKLTLSTVVPIFITKDVYTCRYSVLTWGSNICWWRICCWNLITTDVVRNWKSTKTSKNPFYKQSKMPNPLEVIVLYALEQNHLIKKQEAHRLNGHLSTKVHWLSCTFHLNKLSPLHRRTLCAKFG